jgi:signal transduction histidine kinase
VRELRGLGLSVAFFAGTVVALKLLFAVGSAAVGSLIFWRRSANPMALLASLMLVAFAAGAFPAASGGGGTGSRPGLEIVFPLVAFLASTPGVLLLYVFPDGRFVPAWTRWVAVLLVVLVGSFNFLPESVLARWVRSDGIFLTLVFVAIAVYVQVYRYRVVSGPVEREQTKWVVYGAVVAGVGYLCVQTIFPLLGAVPVALLWAGYAINYGCLLVIPGSIGVAILRSHLWDIDLVINRTLVYGTLTVSVIGLYVLIVGSLSAAFQTRGNLVVSLLATGVVAMAFQPLRDRLQRGVNTLLYGQRDDPYAVLSQLGQRLEATLAPETVLPTIVETVAQALKLPHAAILLKEGTQFVSAAAYGDPAGQPLQLPLVYQAETVGQLMLSPRTAGEAWSPADRRLLEDLGHQAGVAAHTVRLAADLQRLTSDLQRARERLVVAREEERRRLRRDLHDGLGSALAALNFRAGAIRSLLVSDPAAADALVVEQRDGIRAAIADIRRLVYELRPPALDELGLVAAIRERATHFSGAAVAEPAETDSLRVTVEAPDQLPPLPAAVEVAAYRIVQEALANVAGHAHARTCAVRLALAPSASTEADYALDVEITDDGVGLPAEQRMGVGMLSMRERAEELGGTCVIEGADGGTRVRARLPLTQA